MNIKAIKLIKKSFPRLEYHTGTGNGVSAEKHGGKNDTLGATEQGNIFSGVSCRDVSYVMLRILDKNKLGIIIRSSYNGEIEQIVVISHVNNVDLCASGEECEKKIQEIIIYCEKMYETTWGKVQKEKVSTHRWQRENQIIKEKPKVIKLKDENIKS